jgi:hypothetical protein
LSQQQLEQPKEEGEELEETEDEEELEEEENKSEIQDNEPQGQTKFTIKTVIRNSFNYIFLSWNLSSCQ